jgi:hypothetical protein
MGIALAKSRGKQIAMMYSFIASCNEADVNTYEWLTSTLNKIGNKSIHKLHELLTNNFKKL